MYVEFMYTVMEHSNQPTLVFTFASPVLPANVKIGFIQYLSSVLQPRK